MGDGNWIEIDFFTHGKILESSKVYEFRKFAVLNFTFLLLSKQRMPKFELRENFPLYNILWFIHVYIIMLSH